MLKAWIKFICKCYITGCSADTFFSIIQELLVGKALFLNMHFKKDPEVDIFGKLITYNLFTFFRNKFSKNALKNLSYA